MDLMAGARVAEDTDPYLDPRTVAWEGRLLDPEALKALAHPLRVRLYSLIHEHGASTASALGRLVGESSGTTSYHLRKLAEHGLIEEAEGVGTGRDRYWRSGERALTIPSREYLARDDTRVATRMILDEFYATRIQRIRTWDAEGSRWPKAWQEASQQSTLLLHLRPEELASLTRQLNEVLMAIRDTHAEPGEGTRPVQIALDLTPTGPVPGEAIDR